jgi:acetolactate synthase-1/2/3 large subunit
MMQGFEFKEGQRLFHDFNNTAMGYGLPASIGASIALGGKKVVCVTGDGSLQMNIQELITVLRHKLPIKIFLLNNHGHSMVQQTQEQWLGGKYVATSIDGGLAFPDFVAVAKAYGYPTITITQNAELPQKLQPRSIRMGRFFAMSKSSPNTGSFLKSSLDAHWKIWTRRLTGGSFCRL